MKGERLARSIDADPYRSLALAILQRAIDDALPDGERQDEGRACGARIARGMKRSEILQKAGGERRQMIRVP